MRATKPGIVSSALSGFWGDDEGVRGVLQIAAVLLAVFLASLAVDRSDKAADLASHSKLPMDETHQQATSSINRHLQDTDRQIFENSQSVEAENIDSAPSVTDRDVVAGVAAQAADPDALGLSFDHEDTAARTYRDLDRRNSAADYPSFPTDRIAALQEQRKWIGQYDRQQKEAFIRSYVANANAAGYDVVINDQMQVVKVSKRNMHRPLNLPLAETPIDRSALPSGAR